MTDKQLSGMTILQVVAVQKDQIEELQAALTESNRQRDVMREALEELGNLSSVTLGAGTFAVREIVAQALKETS